MKKDKFYDIRDWFLFESFDDYIYMKNGVKVAVLEVKTINFSLKSDMEQSIILESYRKFLKQCDFDMQIVATSFKVDVSNHIKSVEKYSFGNSKLENMKNSYLSLLDRIVENKNCIERKFFVILKVDKNINENINKVISGLNECGNEVVLCNKEIIEQLLKNYLKRNVEIESY